MLALIHIKLLNMYQFINLLPYLVLELYHTFMCSSTKTFELTTM
nr:MAG TPA: hypothetical protein [Caudoviricetes sp.]